MSWGYSLLGSFILIDPSPLLDQAVGSANGPHRVPRCIARANVPGVRTFPVRRRGRRSGRSGIVSPAGEGRISYRPVAHGHGWAPGLHRRLRFQRRRLRYPPLLRGTRGDSAEGELGEVDEPRPGATQSRSSVQNLNASRPPVKHQRVNV